MKHKFIDNVGTAFILVGTVFVFVSVWSDGWLILRILITGLLLIACGSALQAKASMMSNKTGD